MQSSRIAELLTSYIVGLELPPGIYDQLGAYLEILLRWNAKTNLTAIRDPEQIVMRHFGESLFAAGVLFGNEVPAPGLLSRAQRNRAEGPAFSDDRQLATDNLSPSSSAPSKPGFGLGGIEDAQPPSTTLADLGSGAGFPGLPIKLAFPALQVTLIESQNKKATFLKEVIRALRLEGVEVYSGRAEKWSRRVDIVTMRGVEKFELVLPAAIRLLNPTGRLCLLIGAERRKALADIPLALEVEKIIPRRPESMVIVGKI